MGGVINLTGVPDFDQFEVVKEGSTSITIVAGLTTKVTIAHNLGFNPFILAAFDHVGIGGVFTDGDVPLPTWGSVTIDSVNHVINFGSWIQAAADMTNGYILAFSGLAANQGPFTIKYYLLRKRSR